MKRNPIELSTKEYDLLIIGGGIYGAWLAWDAALRGLSVALVEKDDFGGATSSNTLRIVHGGLRYLQNLNIQRARESIRERTTLMGVAPHLVHPLPFVIPTYKSIPKSRLLFSLALKLNDIVGFDRNSLSDPQKKLPGGKIISRKDCLELFPEIDSEGLTGGAVFYDSQIYNSERLLISLMKSAAEIGADVANYMEVKGFLRDKNTITGVSAVDKINNEVLEIRARALINTTGPWVSKLLNLLNHDLTANERPTLSLAFNILTRPVINKGYALGVWSRKEFIDKDAFMNKRSRLLFITPWHDFSLIGTSHLPYDGNPDELNLPEKEISDFLDELNGSYHGANLKRADIKRVLCGYIPATFDKAGTGSVNLAKRPIIIDHQKTDGLRGLISIVGVKFTEARLVAEKVLDTVLERLNKKRENSKTAETQIYGGSIDKFDQFLGSIINETRDYLNEDTARHLVYSYGSGYGDILELLSDGSPGKGAMDPSSVIRAEVRSAVSEEMALKLSDVIFRRTGLGLNLGADDKRINDAAVCMAEELGWDEARTARELEELRGLYFN